MSDSVNQARAFEVLTATPVRARRKPRDWSDDEKARLISEALLPGANVSAIARTAGLILRSFTVGAARHWLRGLLRVLRKRLTRGEVCARRACCSFDGRDRRPRRCGARDRRY